MKRYCKSNVLLFKILFAKLVQLHLCYLIVDGGEWVELKVDMHYAAEAARPVTYHEPGKVNSAIVWVAATACNEAQQHCVDLVHRNMRIFDCCCRGNKFNGQWVYCAGHRTRQTRGKRKLGASRNRSAQTYEVWFQLRRIWKGGARTELSKFLLWKGLFYCRWLRWFFILFFLIKFRGRNQRTVGMLCRTLNPAKHSKFLLWKGLFVCRWLRWFFFFKSDFAAELIFTPFSQVSSDRKPVKLAGKRSEFSTNQHWNRTSGSDFGTNQHCG